MVQGHASITSFVNVLRKTWELNGHFDKESLLKTLPTDDTLAKQLANVFIVYAVRVLYLMCLGMVVVLSLSICITYHNAAKIKVSVVLGGIIIILIKSNYRSWL